jgi:quinol monooxygenase YgiN
MNTLQVNARFQSHPSANLLEFKELAARALELTRGEAGTLQYD